MEKYVSMKESDLKKEIRKAFKDVSFPGNTPEDIGLAPWHYAENNMEGFLGKKWRDIDLDFIKDGRESSLHVMTPKAIRYYLPAFLLASFDADARKNAFFTSVIVCVLSPWSLYGSDLRESKLRKFHDRFDALNSKQKKCIQNYLIFRSQTDGEVERRSSVLALENYWGDF